MSYDDEIDKDRLYFTQNNKPIRLRCPECVRTKKVLRHCKVFKNLAALWYHIRREHGDISNLWFTTNDLIQVLNSLDRAIKWSIIAL